MAVASHDAGHEPTSGLTATIVALLLAVLTHARRGTVGLYNRLARKFGYAEAANPDLDAELPIMGQVRMIGGAVVGIAVITLVVNEVLTIDSINNSSGPFTGVIDSLETTGVAAMTLLVVGLVVAAAGAIMSFMGRGF
jgi:hypothetical protein